MLRLWQRQTTQVQALGNRTLAHGKRISRPYRMPIGDAIDSTYSGCNGTRLSTELQSPFSNGLYCTHQFALFNLHRQYHQKMTPLRDYQSAQAPASGTTVHDPVMLRVLKSLSPKRELIKPKSLVGTYTPSAKKYLVPINVDSEAIIMPLSQTSIRR